MGLRQLGEQDLVRADFEDRSAEDDCAFPLRDIPVAGAATLAWERVHLSLADQYADAEGLYKRSLAIREEKLGRDHPDVAQTLSNLGILYRNQGKYAEAEAHYKRAPGDL
jgi:tetratricopeptide (TPR) repeat protein